jgi:hypothetical protein
MSWGADIVRGIFAVMLAAVASACSPSISSYVDHYEPAGEPGLPYAKTRERDGLQGTYMLPRTIFSLELKIADKVPTLHLSKTVETDPRGRMLYRFEPSIASHDLLEVVTDEAGLLTSISSDTHDKTGEIAVKIAELIYTVATKGASGPVPAALPGDVPQTTPFKASYDPLNPIEVAPVRRRLAELDHCILVGDETLAPPNSVCAKARPQAMGPIAALEAPIAYAHRYPGIFYRRAIPTPIRIYKREPVGDKGHKEWKLLFSGNELLFNQSDLYEVKIDRYAFVKGVTTITFVNGSLQKINLNKPSEALEVVSVPVRILKLAFSIPGAALAKDKQLVDAETALLESQAKKISAEAQLVKLQLQRAGQGAVATPSE